MPDPGLSIDRAAELHQFIMTATVFGSIRPGRDLHRQTQRAIKSHTSGQDFFTEITLHDLPQPGSMRIEYTVTASSPDSAERAGAVYLSHLCDLLSATTRSPLRFFMLEEDGRDDRVRASRKSTSLDRILSAEEWQWIVGSLVFLRRKHSRYLAAASWYRKGLIGSDVLENFCCFWRVIERIALSYADKSKLNTEDKGRAKPCVVQLTSDLFSGEAKPEVLSDERIIGEIVRLRNNLSHGNEAITIEVIDQASSYLKPLEAAAYEILGRIKRTRLKDDSVG